MVQIGIMSSTQQTANAMLKDCLQKDKILKSLRENPKENGAEIARLVSEQRTSFRCLLIEYPEYCASSSKDVDGMLWRYCFYTQIVQYRRSIRKTLDVIDKIGRQSQAHLDKANAHLLHLNNAFKKFLVDSTMFYQELLQQVISW